MCPSRLRYCETNAMSFQYNRCSHERSTPGSQAAQETHSGSSDGDGAMEMESTMMIKWK